MTEAERARELDRVRARIFIGANSAFLGPLMASLEPIIWTKAIDTSATDYVHIYWNPDDFDRLTVDERVASLLHELGHVYRLHALRKGDRDPEDWNAACDIPINNDLIVSGHTCVVNNKWFITKIPGVTATLEEEIYEQLKKLPPPPMPAGGGGSSPPQSGSQSQQPPPGGAGSKRPGSCACHQLGPITKDQAQTAVQNVVMAVQAAKLGGKPGHIPGGVEQILNTFLKPRIPWRQHVGQWFNDKLGTKYSLQRPNRRYLSHGLVMKSRFQDNERLAHLVYAFDVSGSVTDDQVTVFNSELKYLKDTYEPRKMTLILFDTKVRKVIEINEEDDWKELKIVGRGGTDLRDVRKFIMDKQNEVTAAIIFSDLECAPMEPGPKIPILWVCIDNPDGEVPFGKLIHINASDLV